MASLSIEFTGGKPVEVLVDNDFNGRDIAKFIVPRVSCSRACVVCFIRATRGLPACHVLCMPFRRSARRAHTAGIQHK